MEPTWCGAAKCCPVLYPLLAVLWLGLAVGCAPVISPAVLQQVDRELSFGVLAANPDAYRGKMVLLGGEIACTTPKPEITELEIVQKNLDARGKPQDTDASGGRFLVHYAGFLDPAIYRKGRLITVAGEVKGSEVRKLAEAEYRYPMIAARELHLWPKPAPQVVLPPYYWPPYPYFYWGPYYWRHPWFWP